MKYHGFLNRPTVIVADPKIIQQIAVNQVYDFIKPNRANAIAIVGRGLVFVEGETHKKQRKTMIPAFTHVNIKVIIFH
jgi:cytochrome P450